MGNIFACVKDAFLLEHTLRLRIPFAHCQSIHLLLDDAILRIALRCECMSILFWEDDECVGKAKHIYNI